MIEFFVAGVPQSQGSTRAFVVKGRAVTTSANPKNKSWRESVAAEFRVHCTSLLEIPIRVELEFVMPRTTSLPKTKTRPHTTKPDLDKLIRSIFDAGSGVAWADDARVNRISATKRYADIGEQSGVWIAAATDPHSDHSRRFERRTHGGTV